MDEYEQPTEQDIKEFEELQGELADTYYLAIGKGITIWSQTEGGLVVIGAMLLDSEVEKAGLVFYSITNFHTWLSIIDELFAMDPRFQALLSDWRQIAERLKKLNDTRVRLAHHAVHAGKGIGAMAAGEGLDVLMPSLKPNHYDTRTKSKKHSPVQLVQLVDFVTELGPVSTKLGKLVEQMVPIYLDPRRKLVTKIRDLQQEVSDLRAKKGS